MGNRPVWNHQRGGQGTGRPTQAQTEDCSGFYRALGDKRPYRTRGCHVAIRVHVNIQVNDKRNVWILMFFSPIIQMCNGVRREDFEVSAELHGEAPTTADGEGDPAGGGVQEPAGGQLLP